MARPIKLTPELQQNIVAAVLNGNAAETAAEAYGITDRCFYNWMSLGRDGEDESDIYVQFYQAVTQARAKAEMGAVDALRVGMLTDPRFAVEWLKRARHKRWSEKQEHEVRVGPLEQLSDEELEKKALEKLQSVTLMLRGKDEE